jgi:hypothetical protein
MMDLAFYQCDDEEARNEMAPLMFIDRGGHSTWLGVRRSVNNPQKYLRTTSKGQSYEASMCISENLEWLC